MQRAGATPAQIRKAIEAHDPVIMVHPDNWDAVQVFRNCTVPAKLGMAGAYFECCENVEIECAARAYGVAFDMPLLRRVRTLGIETANVRNEAARQRSG